MKRGYEKKESRLQKARMLVAAVCMMAVLGGCGAVKSTVSTSILEDQDMTMAENASYNMEDMDSGQMGAEVYPEETAAVVSAGRSGNTGMPEIDQSAAHKGSEHKLIKTVDLSVETKEFDQVLGTLQSQVKELGGYIENMETGNGSVYADDRSARRSRMTIRIPKEQTDGFLETVTDICNVVSRSESVEDVTLDYVDLESHINVLRTEQDRLVELLGRAETIEDILTIENRLSEVRYQIESMESQLRTYDNRVDYSTVRLYIEEVKDLTPDLTPVEEETVWERISGGFSERLEHLGEGFVEFIIWFLVNTPYLIVFAAIVAAAVLIIRGMGRRIRKKKQKKQKKQQAQQAQQQTQAQQEQQQVREQTQQSQK